MSLFSQKFCAHAGLVWAICIGLGIFGIAGWLPLPAPGTSAQDIAALFQDHQIAIRIGVTLAGVGSVLVWPFSVAISQQLHRMEGPRHPLADTQMISSTGAVLAVLLPAYVWLAMAYRPDVTSPETLQMANDFNWFLFVGFFPPSIVQNVCIGLCILRATPDQQVYPRWLGYLNLWTAVLFLPGALLPFFKSGPFAWDGLLGFWVVATAFFTWVLVMWWETLKAIKTMR